MIRCGPTTASWGTRESRRPTWTCCPVKVLCFGTDTFRQAFTAPRWPRIITGLAPNAHNPQLCAPVGGHQRFPKRAASVCLPLSGDHRSLRQESLCTVSNLSQLDISGMPFRFVFPYRIARQRQYRKLENRCAYNIQRIPWTHARGPFLHPPIPLTAGQCSRCH